MYERPHVNLKVERGSTFFRVQYILLSLDRRPAVARSGAEQVRERVFGSFLAATSPREGKAQF